MLVALAAAMPAAQGDGGPDIFFPPTNVAYGTVFSRLGTNTVVEGPSAVASGDGNYLVAFRLAGVDDTTVGSVAYLKIAPNGAVLSTNVLYTDAYYDSENAVIFRTASNSILVFWNLYDYTGGTFPSNALMMLRSTDAGVSWTTNTLHAAGLYTGLAGNAAQCANGKIVLPYYRENIYAGWWVAYSLSSTDDGVTFGADTLIADLSGVGEGAAEPNLTSLGGSNLLCTIRADGVRLGCYITKSSDAGATWSKAAYVFPVQSKVDCIMLANGLLLATYRTTASYTQAYRVSSDTGTTWSAERIIDSRYYIQNYSSAVELYPGMVGLFYAFITDISETNSPLFLRYGTLTGVTPAGTVTALASPAAGGSVSGAGVYPPGSNIALTAAANAGWSFLHWSDGVLNNPRYLSVPVAGVTNTAVFGSTVGLGAALDATNLSWTVGGNAAWYGQTGVQHGTASAAQSGAIAAGQTSYLQVTTNGPGSLQFRWKVSSAPTNQLQFYVNTQLVSQISGNVDWNQFVTFLGTSNQVTLTWVYVKNTSDVAGSDAGWVDQVTWTPCPYAEHVPQLFYQDPSGMLASWVLNGTGGFRFARVLANTGGWALKAAGDIDGDGVSDLLFQNAAGDTGGWFMNADGSVRDARFWFNIGAWEIKACGDYEGTGRGQLFFQTAAGDTAYWRLDTNGNFLASVPLGRMGGWKLRGAGDLDGDHKAELFWQNAAGQVAVWYHNPDASIGGAVVFSTGAWALCGVTDIDGDGVSDLLWQTPAGDVAGWFMNSNSTVRAASFWWNTGAWKLKAAGQ